MTALDIGFIGLGVMGAPMATHLARAGHRLKLHDADSAAARNLAAALGGAATAFDTPAALATGCDIVITMLPNGRVVQRIALGEQGLMQGLKRGALLLDTSSSEPWLTQPTAAALAERGVAMVDAPVSGAQWGAQEANLVFMVGGAAADVERVRPLLDLMGRAVFHVGGLGAGHAMKCINNLITSITFGATVEGLAIGKRYGLDPAAMVDVLDESTGGSWITHNHIRQRVLSRSFDDPFKLELMLKDIGIALELAREANLSVPLSDLSQQLWRAAALAAGPGASVSELARWVEQQTGTPITPGAAARSLVSLPRHSATE
jgi:3-hydroxyisobutyrate dehydrogenase